MKKRFFHKMVEEIFMQHSHVKSLTVGFEKKLLLVTTLLSLAMPLLAQEKGPAFFGIGGTMIGKPMPGGNGKPTGPAAPSLPSMPSKPEPKPEPIVDYKGDKGRYGDNDHGGYRDHDRYEHNGGYGRPGHGGNRYSYTEYLQTFVNRTLMGDKVIAVKQLLNLGYGKYGKAIYQVKIEAKSMFGFGTAQLLINGQAVGMPERLSTMLSEKTFEVPGYTNRNDIQIKKLQILVKGQIYVSKVGILIQK